MRSIGVLNKIFLLCFLLASSYWVGAQKYVQLEITNSLTTYKYEVGDRFVYKTKRSPKKWQRQKIRQINYEGGFVEFSQEIVMMDEFTEVRVFKTLPAILGAQLKVFGLVSLVYGGIGDLTQGQLMPQTLIYSIGGLTLGYFLDRFVSYKRYKLGRNANLRLLDVSF